MVLPRNSNRTGVDPEKTKVMEKEETLRKVHQYGSINGSSTSDSCPTCQGTGRIPRPAGSAPRCNTVQRCAAPTQAHEAVRVHLHGSVSFTLLPDPLLLIPSSVTLTPVSVLSVMVYFTPDSVDMEVTNLINMTNENFVPVQIVEFTMQGLLAQTVVGHTKISNLTAIQSRSRQPYIVQIDLLITDPGLNTYCKSSTFQIHTLFLQLQMTMNISYLSHTEQISHEVFEYIDCGNNSTTPIL